VTVLDLHHRGTDPTEERLVGARDIGVDHRDKPQADQVSEGCECGGEVAGGGLDHGCLFADLTSLGRPPEDPVGGAVLDAPNRVVILEFGKKIHSLHCQLQMWCGSLGISEQFETRGETRCRDLIEMFPSAFCEAVVVPPLQLPFDRPWYQQATNRGHLTPSAAAAPFEPRLELLQ